MLKNPVSFLMKMKVLFICHHNRFRSKVAESYLKKINPTVKVSSAGVIRGTYPLSEIEVSAARELGIKISGRPKSLSIKLLRKQDYVVVVADDVSLSLFDYDFLKGKIVQWKITDEYYNDEEKAREIVNQIMKKVEEFNKEIVSALK